ncbi:hypothetical protein BC628DRAFT_1514934 [Trametes gibbosa]|nr:hypothetical protein BC628DRAFT_1514934 [Trametes gibbosa]
MPRFLNTWTGEFVWKNNPARVHYAILSHTWQKPEDGGEQTHAEILKIQAEVAKPHTDGSTPGSPSVHALEQEGAPTVSSSSSPDPVTARVPSDSFFSHPKLSEKIAMACKVAREAGYELLWIDACCIDTSSSAELAEAINSMHAWYRLSDVCYAFLADVPEGDDPTDEDSWFRESRWHRRGWTLQELIAPERVVFLTSTWTVLGTKLGLATTIEDVTGIEFDILIGRAPVGSVSVVRRMSWAARRRTTRVEDRAYSLLGLFGVHMAPIYGEGDNAFLRLQEEILRTVPDQTIFAWEPFESWPSLLAPSPFWFMYNSDVCVTSPVDFASRLRLQIEDVPSLHAVATPQGIRIHLLCVDLAKFSDIAKFIPGLEPLPEDASCDDCRRLPRAHLLALLRCHDSDGALLALPLCRPPPGMETGLHVAHQVYCTHLSLAGLYYPKHVVSLPETVLGHILARQPLSTVDVSILRHHSHPSVSRSTTLLATEGGELRLWSDGDSYVEFEFNPNSVHELGVHGFHLSPLQRTQSSEGIVLSFTLSSNSLRRPWTSNLPRQKVAVDISLTPLTDCAVKAVFSSTNFTFGPAPNSDGSVTPPEFEVNTIDETFDVPRSFLLDVGSGAYVPEGHSTSKFDINRSTPYVLSHAEFAIYVGPDEDQEGVVRLRWLKLSVQRSKERPNNCLNIAVELSDVRNHHHTPADRATGGRHLDLGIPDSEPGKDVDNTDLLPPPVRQPSIQTLLETVETLTSRVDALSSTLSYQNTVLSARLAAVIKQLGDVSDPSVDVASSSDPELHVLVDTAPQARIPQASPDRKGGSMLSADHDAKTSAPDVCPPEACRVGHEQGLALHEPQMDAASPQLKRSLGDERGETSDDAECSSSVSRKRARNI